MNKLKSIRQSKMIKQKELAEALGITAGYVSNWENGRSKPKASLVKKMCDFFSCTKEDLGFENSVTIKQNNTRLMNIILLCNQKGMTQVDISKKIGCSKQYIHKLFQGGIILPSDFLEKIAKILLGDDATIKDLESAPPSLEAVENRNRNDVKILENAWSFIFEKKMGAQEFAVVYDTYDEYIEQKKKLGGLDTIIHDLEMKHEIAERVTKNF